MGSLFENLMSHILSALRQDFRILDIPLINRRFKKPELIVKGLS